MGAIILAWYVGYDWYVGYVRYEERASLAYLFLFVGSGSIRASISLCRAVSVV